MLVKLVVGMGKVERLDVAAAYSWFVMLVSLPERLAMCSRD
jgi:hypothetical protein